MSEQTTDPVSDEEFFERGYQHYAKVARVTATVHFEVYIVDGVPYSNGRDLEETITDEICDAVGIRAVSGTDTEPGVAMIAMTTYPEHAVEVTGLFVDVIDQEVDPQHVLNQAEGTSGMW
jgi:hypothetical protein